MIKVLFVCHGNICRSPMAEIIFNDMAEKRRLGDKYTAESAATSTEELGNPVYPPAKREIERHGIRVPRRCARQITRRDYDDYDLLIGMEHVNLRNMLRMLGGDPENKMRLLLSYTGREADIDDPWYTGRFAEVYAQIEQGCAALLDALERGEA